MINKSLNYLLVIIISVFLSVVVNDHLKEKRQKIVIVDFANLISDSLEKGLMTDSSDKNKFYVEVMSEIKSFSDHGYIVIDSNSVIHADKQYYFSPTTTVKP